MTTTPESTFPEVSDLIRHHDTHGLLTAVEELLAEARTRCEKAAQAHPSPQGDVRITCLSHASVYVTAVLNGLTV